MDEGCHIHTLQLYCRHYGDTYKWLLWTDDDTVMHLPAIELLLKSYDPKLPHAISGV